MKNNSFLDWARWANLAFSFGITTLVTMFLGYWGGNWLDGKLGTSPLFLVVGLLAAVGMSFYNLLTELGIFHSLAPPPGSSPPGQTKDGTPPDGGDTAGSGKRGRPKGD